MTLESRLVAAFQAVAADVKALLAGKVDNDDQRLSNSREWTASVVSQAEAESGASTTARKWTSQRVRQAIIAWWGTIGTTFGKSILGAANASAARTTLGLGTAANVDTGNVAGKVPLIIGDARIEVAGGNPAYRMFNSTSGRTVQLNSSNSGNVGFYDIDASQWFIRWGATNDLSISYSGSFKANNYDVLTTERITTSSIDTTPGRLLKVGDFGVGVGVNIPAPTSLNTILAPGNYSTNSLIDAPPGASGDAVLVVMGRVGADLLQLYHATPSNGLWIRKNDTTFTETGWSSWKRLVEEGDFSLIAGVKAWHSSNTSIDSNGFIKRASPIVKLYSDHTEKNDSLEVQSVQFEKLATGRYQLSNCPPLSNDGWYLEQPKNRNGDVYHNVEWHYDEAERTLRIETFARSWNSQTGQYDNGAAVDTQSGRFISLRFEENPELYPIETEEEVNGQA